MTVKQGYESKTFLPALSTTSVPWKRLLRNVTFWFSNFRVENFQKVAYRSEEIF